MDDFQSPVIMYECIKSPCSLCFSSGVCQWLSPVRLCDLMDCSLLLCFWNFPGKNAGIGFHSLLQGIFPTLVSNPRLLHRRNILYCLSQLGNPNGKFKVQSLSHVRLSATLGTAPYQAPPSMGFSRQEYWSGVPLPSPEYLPDPGIKPGSLTLQADTLPSEPPGKSNPNGVDIKKQDL